jgi:hypothetical protein
VGADLTSGVIDLLSRDSATIVFDWFIEQGLDSGEYLAFEVSRDGGATWEEKTRLRGNVDTEHIWHTESIDISDIDSLKIRFLGNMSSASEDAFVENIEIIAN